ncbi:GNAT family N-acetyltransferase [Yimella sp. cx-51]|uniref:GNAT family N-acetyltransferase n=1 Tax=Yimella sp. cx-51 TaxID=2770551 RepID=UPI00165E0FD1|nr:GNAT family N-acetyltransferase [Yimella sp. cx-51]MBC9955536.1 GNAT family N-acetyltransferase [Yimella sp. cx-51]QTH37880.1 GNAT family N-acetyltransferase [Yimella sp. cx-51]
MRVTTWTLEMRSAAELTGPTAPPPPFTVVESRSVTPEYARFLYGLIGGPWTWTDRLSWSRDQWAADLAVPATTFLVAYADGVPHGYLQLGASTVAESSEIEIKYFGLVEDAIGKGLGSALLTRGIERAWQASELDDVPPVLRVWVHTCSLDGPAALRTYQSRGLKLIDETVTQETYPEQPLGSWVSTGGPA